MKLFGHHIIFAKGNLNSVLHQDTKKLVDFAFHLKGYGPLYNFGNMLDMPVERFFKYSRFESEYRNRFSYDDFGNVLDNILNSANNGKLTEIVKTASLAKELIDSSLDIDTMYKLLSCFYLAQDEDITDYDYDFNVAKIKAMKEQKLSDFFLSEPVRSLFGLQTTSVENLEAIKKLTGVKGDFLQKLNLSAF